MERFKFCVQVGTSVMIGSVLGSIAVSFAGDSNTTTSNIVGASNDQAVIPYSGFLSLNSAPEDGQRDLEFELYDSATGGAPLWLEQQQVTFFQGRFSVGLGASDVAARTALKTLINDGEELYLAIKVKDDSGNFVALSGRQKIDPAPFAVWADHSTDLKVSRIIGPNTGSDSLKMWGSGQRFANQPATPDLVIDKDHGNVVVEKSLVVRDSIAAEDNLTVGGQTAFSGGLDVNGATRLNGGATSNGLTVAGGALHIATTDITVAGNARGAGGYFFVHGWGNRIILNYLEQFSSTYVEGLLEVVNLAVSGATTFGSGVTFNSSATFGSDATFNSPAEFNSSISGLDNGLSISVEKSYNTHAHAHNLGVTRDEGFCYLTGMRVDHNALDPLPSQCRIYSGNPNNTWYLALFEGPGAADLEVVCYVHCVEWK